MKIYAFLAVLLAFLAVAFALHIANMTLYRWRIKPKHKFFYRLSYLLLISTWHFSQMSAAITVDLTTEHAAPSKTSAITTRSIKSKVMRLPLVTATTPASLAMQLTTISSSKAVTTDTSVDDNQVDEEIRHQLISVSSKSYISGPTTEPTSKLSKRAGHLPDVKYKKIYVHDKNRTRVHEGRAKPPKENVDHQTDSSGHIPYRIAGPHLLPPPPPADYQSDTSLGDISYNQAAASYESEKWQQEYWDPSYSKHYAYNNTKVKHIEAECQDDFMKIRIGFNGSFNGLVYSAGYAYDPDCMYINGSGRDYYEFYIQLNRCGTLGKNALHDESRKNPSNFMWNTVTVQYNPLIEEEFDEHFKVTCEYGYDFWKTVTFPFLDVEVATGNPVVFTLSPPECYMEIQNGYGIGGPRVTGPVRVGDPLTLIIYMRSKYDGFDIVVNDCFAHNGANKRIQLIDDLGCPVDDKLISRFRGSWSDSGVFETQVYAYMKTFRFTGSPALYIECDVRMCHGRCPSQPCHWRNLKAVTKRDISNATAAAFALPLVSSDDTDKPETPLSENVNLFQSLRVLQEGESDGETSSANARARSVESANANHTCMKTSSFSAMTASFSLMICLLTVALMIACSRLQQRRKSTIYDSYISHKGQID